MGYKWLPLTSDFNRSLPILKTRWDINIETYIGSNTDQIGYFAESPNIYADGADWTNRGGATWGYAAENRWNCKKEAKYAPNTFCLRYHNLNDIKWNNTNYTTLVSGTTYEYTYPVPLYYAGTYREFDPLISTKIFLYIEKGLDISTYNLDFLASGGTGTIDISSENPWTASTQSDWISITPISGLTDATVTISAPYNAFNQRTGTVTFTDGEDTIDLTVTQKGNTLIPFKKMYKNGNRIN